MTLGEKEWLALSSTLLGAESPLVAPIMRMVPTFPFPTPMKLKSTVRTQRVTTGEVSDPGGVGAPVSQSPPICRLPSDWVVATRVL